MTKREVPTSRPPKSEDQRFQDGRLARPVRSDDHIELGPQFEEKIRMSQEAVEPD